MEWKAVAVRFVVLFPAKLHASHRVENWSRVLALDTNCPDTTDGSAASKLLRPAAHRQALYGNVRVEPSKSFLLRAKQEVRSFVRCAAFVGTLRLRANPGRSMVTLGAVNSV